MCYVITQEKKRVIPCYFDHDTSLFPHSSNMLF